MRTPDRILMLAALGVMSGLAPAFGFEGTARPSVEVITPATPNQPPSGMAPASANSRAIDVPRPPGAIPRAGGIQPAMAIPNAALPRPTAPVPSLAAPIAPLPDRALPPPTAFAAPAAPITPFEAFRSGAKALRDGQKDKALVSLGYAAEQGLVAAQWKLGRMYAEGDGVPRSDLRAFEYFSGIADAHADDNPGTPQARYVANAFVALGHYYRDGIPNTDVKPDLGRARHMYAYAASYFGDPDAQYHLGRLMLDGPFKDPRQGARWLHSAANKGQYQAQALLGRMLFRGEPGVVRQPARGFMWLTLARANAGPSETWIAESYDSAAKQVSEEDRGQAGEFLMQWLNGKRD
jgi:exopolysaccharide production negative regulator